MRLVGRRGVARDHDRPIAGVEAIAERRHDRRMIDQRRGDLDVLVLQDDAALAQLVGVDQRRERHPAFVGDARVDVGRVHLEEQARHLLERRRTPGVDRRAQPGRPRQPDQVAVVRVVVGVMVRDEDVAQRRQRHAGEHQLPSDAVAAVDDVGHAVDDDAPAPDAELALRGRGPPPVPSRISRVFAPCCPPAVRGQSAAAAAAARPRNSRRPSVPVCNPQSASAINPQSAVRNPQYLERPARPRLPIEILIRRRPRW